MFSTKINIKVLFSIVIISSVIGLIFNTFSSERISLIREKEEILFTNITDLNPDSTSTEIRALDTKTVKELFDQEKAVFIDARDKWEFGEGHISGAINVAEYKYDKDKSKLENIAKDRLIIIYCGGDDCDLSKRVYKKMQSDGFKNIFVYLDGFSIWQENNFPIQKVEE
ncbi:MAG: rhodanese-like domain-containing protein [Melioribacteraceae bacterium]|nr:rhodanese-like domain-containing protein [Melioribacteraceae bacterium]